jgi:hypothetical protein
LSGKTTLFEDFSARWKKRIGVPALGRVGIAQGLTGFVMIW